MKAQRHAKTIGIALVAVAAVETFVLANEFGIRQGVYFWFYHLALFGAGLGLLLRDRALIVAYFTAAVFPLGLYSIEHLLRALFGVQTGGLTDFLYNPGLSAPAFILGHSHFFFWPAALFGLMTLEPRKNEMRRTFLYILGFQATIWAISYFAFPTHQNINCIHAPCSSLPWDLTERGYRFAFISLLLLLNLVAAWVFYRNPIRQPRNSKRFRAGFAIAGLALVCLSALDVTRWALQPHFRCAPPFEDENVRIGCDYTLEHGSNQMMLVYSVFNKAQNPRFCFSRIALNGDEQPLHDEIWAEPRTETEIWVAMPHPTTTTTAKLSARCED